MNKVVDMPTKDNSDVLKAALECPNCGHKLFYVTTIGVVCYKCKTVSVPESE